jgi:sugar lactone lactonase YvrE
MTNKNLRAGVLAAASLAFLTAQAMAQITTEIFAGNGEFADVAATSISVNPTALVIAPDGTVFVADQYRGKVVRLDPATGTATSVLESGGRLGFLKGIALDAAGNVLISSQGILRFDAASGNLTTVGSSGSLYDSGQIAVNAAGTVFVSAKEGFRIFEVRSSGELFRYAGAFSAGFSGDGGTATDAQIDHPEGIAVDPSGNLYFADSSNHRVRRIDATTRIITTVAGTGEREYNGDNEPPLLTNLYRPQAVALDAAGNLYIAEETRIRRLNVATGLLQIIAGTGDWGYAGDGGPATSAHFYGISTIAFDAAGDLYIGDTGNRRVRRIDAATGIITTVMGNGEIDFCGDDGLAIDACIHHPLGVEVDANDNVYVGDAGNGRIRRIAADTGIITTIAAGFESWVGGIAFDAAGNLVISEFFGNRIRRRNSASGTTDTVAGTGVAGFSGDGGDAQLARLSRPVDVALDAEGNIFIADFDNHRIRRVDAATNVITTFAGNGVTNGPLGDGGPAHLASLYEPDIVEFDRDGNLLISDRRHLRVRKVNMASGIITTIAGGGTQPGENVPATSVYLGAVTGIAIDAAGDMYLSLGSGVRKIDGAGIITTVPGAHGQYLGALEFDSSGRLYVTETGSSQVLRVNGIPVAPADVTPPVIQPTVSGTQGQLDWYRSDVSVTWTVTDSESSVSSSTGCSSTTVSTDTSGLVLTCTATSGGGTATGSVTIKRDTVAPTVTFGVAYPAPNAAGWNNTDVNMPYTLTDDLSGVLGGAPASPAVLSFEGFSVSALIYAYDIAGNLRTIGTPGVAIDKTPPSITLLYPEANLTYGAFTSINAQYVCNDALTSQVACVGTVPHGAPIPASTAGAKTFSVTATDLAGNVSMTSRPYTVAALQFERFIEPLRRSPTFNAVTAGSLVPIRWRLLSAGQVVTNPAAFQSISVFNLTCQGAGIPLNDTATGGPGLSVNPANGYFTYNWQTDASWAGTCRRVQIRFGDNSFKEVVFRLQ